MKNKEQLDLRGLTTLVAYQHSEVCLPTDDPMN